jgi:hypothetical protein
MMELRERLQSNRTETIQKRTDTFAELKDRIHLAVCDEFEVPPAKALADIDALIKGMSDAGFQFHYYRLTADNSILWGGYDTIYNYGGKVRLEYEFRAETYATLAAHFLRTFPQLEGIRFTHAWGGAIDTCSRFFPFWGTAHRGRVAYVLGFTGLGVASTRFGAAVMLDLLDGLDTERTRLKMVRRKPLPFPPEPLRYGFIRLTQWSIDRADRHEGRRNAWIRLMDRLGLGFDS